MKIAGIIAEYNPFHSGHLFHIEKTKERADAVVCVISGAFTQRGLPALTDKWSRARMAAECGADLVLELPYPFSAAPAEIFAFGGVSLLHRLGCVDFLSFGSESGDIEGLKKAAAVLDEKEADISKHIKENAGEGKSFAAAVAEYTKDYAELLSEPNNLLGIKYINALRKLGSGIEPFTVKRDGDYNSKEFDGKFASAAAIRQAVKEEKTEKIKKYMPQKAYDIFKNEINSGNVYDIEKLDLLFTGILRTERKNLKSFAYIAEGLENRFVSAAEKNFTVEDILSAVKTKRYTHTRLSRAALSILLGTEAGTVSLHAQKGAAYAKVLAANKTGLKILGSVKEKFPVISRGADYKKLDSFAAEQFELEMKAQNIAALCCKNKSKMICGRDLLEKPYIIE